MNSQLRQKAVDLRLDEELSYAEIRKRLGVPKSTLSYWLREYPLSEKKILELRRKGWKKGEASRERFRNTMRKIYEEKVKHAYENQKGKLKKISRDAIYVAGLMLYLGEGKKKDRYTISLSNTDPSIMKFFVRWMNDFLGISIGDIRVQLHLYENMAVEKEQKFWENTLGIKKAQFYKVQVRKLRPGSFNYRDSYRHGTCQISYSQKDKKMELTSAIKAFTDLYLKEEMRP